MSNQRFESGTLGLALSILSFKLRRQQPAKHLSFTYVGKTVAAVQDEKFFKCAQSCVKYIEHIQTQHR